MKRDMQFLGTVGYYRKCIPKFADRVKLLMSVTRQTSHGE